MSDGPTICTRCGAENRPGRKFCAQCGASLALPSRCPNCGAVNEPGERFCGECGTQLGVTPAADVAPVTTPAAARLDAPAVPVAERRLVSVLFADLVGFTTLSEGRDAEETRELLSRYFETAREIIARYGGTVEKFIGDAVMAVWGTPTAHEDDAERAVRTALDVLDAVRRLGMSLQARAGVLTGEAAVTLGATGQGMVAGDLVNTASRLQSVAAPGTVLVDEATRRAAGKAVAFEPAGEQRLKGREAPVAAFRALRVVAERGGRGRSDRLEAPFVGRESELLLLKEFFHVTGRERRPRLLSITGQAGVGKSRLAWELNKYLDGIVEPVLWNSGRSPAYGDGVTFWALGEIVRQRLGLAENDDEPTTRAKIDTTLDERVPDPLERRTIEPALLTLLGLEAAPTGGRDELFAAWRTFLERGAAGRTTVLAFEDLQWADPGLLDFIDHLLEWSKGVPILVVTLSRPELLERRPDWGAGRRNFVALTLEPLPAAAMRELLAGLVPGLPERAAERIVERAEGIPLYAVETVRMLVAEGRLVEEEDGYRPIGDLSDLAVPETLQALIAARLDGLAADDRALLQDAAVLGQSFSQQALGAVTGLAGDELDTRLHSLVSREILTIQADAGSPERGQYVFVQALIREVAYGTLAKRDRRAKHLAAARYFESLSDDELAGVLAAHYLDAHHESPPGPEANALAVQARLALRGAAERAAALGSHEQAMAFLEQALAVTSDPKELGELLEQAGQAAHAAARTGHAEQLLQRAIGTWQERADPEGVARASARLAGLYSSTARPDEAIRLLEPLAAEDLASFGVTGLLVRSQLARAYFFAGDTERAVATADQVLAAAERAGDVPIVADTLITKGTALSMVGRIQEGRALVAGGRTLAEQHGLAATAIRAYVNESSIVSGLDPRQAFELARRGLDEARRLGQRDMGLALLINANQSAERTGDWAWAVEAAATESPDFEGVVRGNALLEVARLMALRGEPNDEIADEVERLFAGYADIQSTAELESMRALRALTAGELSIASDAWLRAGDLNRSEPNHFLNAGRAALWARDAERARVALERFDRAGVHGAAYDTFRQIIVAGLACLEGRPQEAFAAYREALRAWRDLGLAVDQALTAIDMATLLDPAEPEVRAAAASATEILTRLRATPFLERLEKAIAESAGPAPSRPRATRAQPVQQQAAT